MANGPFEIVPWFHNGCTCPDFPCLFREGLHLTLGRPRLGNMTHVGPMFVLDGHNTGTPLSEI